MKRGVLPPQAARIRRRLRASRPCTAFRPAVAPCAPGSCLQERWQLRHVPADPPDSRASEDPQAGACPAQPRLGHWGLLPACPQASAPAHAVACKNELCRGARHALLPSGQINPARAPCPSYQPHTSRPAPADATAPSTPLLPPSPALQVFAEYVKAAFVSGVETGTFDFVSIDGRARVACFPRALQLLRPHGGVLVLDNAERPYYR